MRILVVTIVKLICCLIVFTPLVANAKTLDDVIIDAIERTQDPGYHVDLVCEKTIAPLRPSASKTARFTVHDDGRLSVDLKAPKGTVTFAKAGIVRIELPSKKVIACDAATAKTIYDVAGGDIANVAVFAPLADKPDAWTYLAVHREKVLGELRQAERDALHTEPTLQGFVTTARAAFALPDNGALDAARARAVAAHDALSEVLTRCKRSEDPYLAPAVCDEAAAIDVTLASSIAAIDDLKTEADLAKRQKAIAGEKLLEAAVALKPSPVSEVVRAQQCDRIQRFRWLDLGGDVPRLLTIAQLPLVDDVSFASYREKVPVAKDVEPTKKRALLVTSIPYSESTKFALLVGDRTTLTPQTLFATLLGPMRSALFPWNLSAGRANFDAYTNSKQFASKVPGGIDEELVERFRIAIEKLVRERYEEVEDELVATWQMHSILCPSETTHLKVDPLLPASSGVAHRSYTFELDDRDHKVTVALCAGEECTGAADDKAVRNRLAITPSAKKTFTLLAELSAGYGIKNGANNESGFATMSAPAFKPILGTQGPDQIYELQQHADPQDVISTALLLAYRIETDTVFAVGPSLTTGASGALFKQWNARFGRDLGAGMLITAGLSVRAVPFPQDFKIGDRVSVPRGMNEKPPDLRTYYTPVLQFEIGLAFDLAGLGSLTSDVFKAIGGK